MKFHIKRAKNKEWYYILTARNGKTLFHSETYKRKAGCHNAIASLKIGVCKAVVIEENKNS